MSIYAMTPTSIRHRRKVIDNILYLDSRLVRATHPTRIFDSVLRDTYYNSIVDGRYDYMGTLQYIIDSEEEKMLYAVVIDFQQINLFIQEETDSHIEHVILINKEGNFADSHCLLTDVNQTNGEPINLNYYFQVKEGKVVASPAYDIQI